MIILTLLVFLYGTEGAPNLKMMSQNFDNVTACEAAGKKFVEVADEAIVDGDNKPMVYATYTCAVTR
jgi:hypothetical protein